MSQFYQKNKDGEHVLNDTCFIFVTHVSVGREREKNQNATNPELVFVNETELAFLTFGC